MCVCMYKVFICFGLNNVKQTHKSKGKRLENNIFYTQNDQ